MKQYLLHAPSKEVVELTVAVNDSPLQWEEENEFSLNSTMYDVLDEKQVGDSMVIRCVPDEKETELVSEYQKINQQNNPSSQQKWASLYKQIDSFFTPALVAYPDYFLPHIAIAFAYYQIHILSPSYPILTPPPQLSNAY